MGTLVYFTVKIFANVYLTVTLQFSDLQMLEDSIKEIENRKTDLYLTEIKMENTIERANGRAKHPRSIERVPKGARFELFIVYNLENIEEAKVDLDNLLKALKLLSWDYLGGSGSRGYGRLKFKDLSLEPLNIIENDNKELEPVINGFNEKLKNDQYFMVSNKKAVGVEG